MPIQSQRCRIVVLAVLLCAMLTFAAEALDMPKFEAQVIDSNVQIGYATAIADIDGDGKPDILLVDKKQICWYRNPDWKRFVLCENVTKQDNVCIAARDLDGDGKAEIAIGAEWNPADTVNSGSVHYLIAPKDRTQKWEVVTLPHEPTVHRMKWLKGADGKFMLIVAPLHGRDNKNAQGAGAKLLAYHLPADLHGEWQTEVIDDSMHVTHNIDVVRWNETPGESILLAGKEGILLCEQTDAGWKKTPLIAAGEQGFNGAGEVRLGRLAGGARFLATVEPFHGTQACLYTAPAPGEKFWKRALLDGTLKEGHAVACADFCGAGGDQMAVGWRVPNAAGQVGINLYLPPTDGGAWHRDPLDEKLVACEDLVAGDLNGDGRIDFVASGRASHNLVIFWNRR